MEYLVGGLIAVQCYTLYMTSKERKSLLNAMMAKSTQEFAQLEKAPRRKVRKPEPVQDDAGIPFGL